MIVLDASALIAFLAPADALHERAMESVLTAGPDALGISPITHAEVLVGPVRAGTLERTQQALAALDVREVPLPADGALRLAGLRSRSRLPLPDCCVVLAAQQCGGAILTFDERLATVAQGLGVGIQAG